MYKFRGKYILTLLLVSGILFGITGVSQGEILPLDDIEPGMTGIGKTVFEGTEVEEFPIEVIDIVRDRGLDRDSLLIRVGGDKLEEIGGIAAGMSGTPIYIEDELAGAISYGWQQSDHRYCLATPIESMLELLDKPDDITLSHSRSGDKSPLKTPLVVSGLSGRSLERLKADLDNWGLSDDSQVLPANNLKEEQGDVRTLEPGSAVAIQLVRGDVNIASIGTLTYIKDDQILAFGHPFTNRGEVNFLLSKARISGIIPSRQQPFKLGSPMDELLGVVSQDRNAGIAGRLKKFPSIIPLKIHIRDQTREVDKEISVQIIKDERFLTSLASNVALQAVDNTLDRIGRGTARTRVRVMGSGLPDLEVEKENVFYSRRDIGSTALVDLYQLLQLITTNPFKEINIIDVQLEMEVEKEDQVALVQEAEVLNEEIHPGDTVDIKVTLHPYRQVSFTKEVSIDLPEDMEPGMTSIVVSGGYSGGMPQMPEETEDDYEINQGQVEGYKDFESMLTDFMEEPRNNELIVQVYPGSTYPFAGMGDGEQQQAKDSEESEPGDPDQPPEPPKPDEPPQPDQDQEQPQDKQQPAPETEPEIKTVEKTDYVLEGSFSVDIEVKSEDSQDPEMAPPSEDSEDSDDEDSGETKQEAEEEQGKI